MSTPTRSARQRPVSVFVSGAGQDDNLGDSVLRRQLLDALRAPGARLHVMTGDNTSSYLAGLGLRADDVLYTSRWRWRGTAIGHAVTRRVVLAFSAGENVAARGSLLGSLADLLILSLVRPRSGGGLYTGIGIRRISGGVSRLVRRTLRACSIVSWRDQPSRDLVGIGEVNPDWAFAADRPATTHVGSRRQLTVVMRGDRALPGAAWLDAVASVAVGEGLELAVLVQVRRDEARAEWLADRLGAALVRWPDDATHADHEQVVREVYRRSAFVVGDRLHALIIGLTEGAVPLGLTVEEPEKLRRTLAVVGLAAACVGEDELASRGGIDAVVVDREDAAAALEMARRRLSTLTERMRLVISDGSTRATEPQQVEEELA